jgi:hypothetical protein
MAQVLRDLRARRWLARWRDPSGHQRKRSFARKVDAQRWLDQALSLGVSHFSGPMSMGAQRALIADERALIPPTLTRMSLDAVSTGATVQTDAEQVQGRAAGRMQAS